MQLNPLGMFARKDEVRSHVLPPLPYSDDALAPVLSEETIRYHYGKHTKGYFDKLQELIEGTALAHLTLEEIVRESQGEIFNNAGQAWNHVFYWSCLGPENQTAPSQNLIRTIERDFGTIDIFKEQFSKQALAVFGSGWTWLVKNPDGHLLIESHPNAGSPIVGENLPLLTCDVWEHAYYIDYRNARKDYLDGFWRIINWDFVSANLENGNEILFH